ncbi:hypothetical protein RFI_03352, partial [Reticulomyxa filosa]
MCDFDKTTQEPLTLVLPVLTNKNATNFRVTNALQCGNGATGAARVLSIVSTLPIVASVNKIIPFNEIDDAIADKENRCTNILRPASQKDSGRFCTNVDVLFKDIVAKTITKKKKKNRTLEMKWYILTFQKRINWSIDLKYCKEYSTLKGKKNNDLGDNQTLHWFEKLFVLSNGYLVTELNHGMVCGDLCTKCITSSAKLVVSLVQMIQSLKTIHLQKTNKQKIIDVYDNPLVSASNQKINELKHHVSMLETEINDAKKRQAVMQSSFHEARTLFFFFFLFPYPIYLLLSLSIYIKPIQHIAFFLSQLNLRTEGSRGQHEELLRKCHYLEQQVLHFQHLHRGAHDEVLRLKGVLSSFNEAAANNTNNCSLQNKADYTGGSSGDENTAADKINGIARSANVDTQSTITSENKNGGKQQQSSTNVATIANTRVNSERQAFLSKVSIEHREQMRMENLLKHLNVCSFCIQYQQWMQKEKAIRSQHEIRITQLRINEQQLSEKVNELLQQVQAKERCEKKIQERLNHLSNGEKQPYITSIKEEFKECQRELNTTKAILQQTTHNCIQLAQQLQQYNQLEKDYLRIGFLECEYANLHRYLSDLNVINGMQAPFVSNSPPLAAHVPVQAGINGQNSNKELSQKCCYPLQGFFPQAANVPVTLQQSFLPPIQQGHWPPQNVPPTTQSAPPILIAGLQNHNKEEKKKKTKVSFCLGLPPLIPPVIDMFGNHVVMAPSHQQSMIFQPFEDVDVINNNGTLSSTASMPNVLLAPEYYPLESPKRPSARKVVIPNASVSGSKNLKLNPNDNETKTNLNTDNMSKQTVGENTSRYKCDNTTNKSYTIETAGKVVLENNKNNQFQHKTSDALVDTFTLTTFETTEEVTKSANGMNTNAREFVPKTYSGQTNSHTPSTLNSPHDKDKNSDLLLFRNALILAANDTVAEKAPAPQDNGIVLVNGENTLIPTNENAPIWTQDPNNSEWKMFSNNPLDLENQSIDPKLYLIFN